MRSTRWGVGWAAACGLSLWLAAGCAGPTVHWSHRVRLNGRTFVFSRVDSLQEGAEGHKVGYENGDFVVEGAGAIAVNGFEIRTVDGGVLLANQRVALSPRDEVHFDRGMSWKVRTAQLESAPQQGEPQKSSTPPPPSRP